MDSFVDYMIRPRRYSLFSVNYSTLQLGLNKFKINNENYERKDFQLRNQRNLILRCSHFFKDKIAETPCIVYCHGNSGSRLDALDILETILPLNISVIAFDFSGSGQSEGEWVSMGYYEKDDIKSVIEYIQRYLNSSHIGIWGRSMGAVSALLYCSQYRTIDFLIVESPFASLRSLCVELVNTHTVFYIQIIPKIIAQFLVSRLKKTVKKVAKFDIDDVEPANYIEKIKCPAILTHSKEDELINIHHAKVLMDKSKGNFTFVETQGCHNAARDKSVIEKILGFIMEAVEEKPFEEEGTENIMPSLSRQNQFSIRNLNLRQDTERRFEAGNYFKQAQKALIKK